MSHRQMNAFVMTNFTILEPQCVSSAITLAVYVCPVHFQMVVLVVMLPNTEPQTAMEDASVLISITMQGLNCVPPAILSV